MPSRIGGYEPLGSGCAAPRVQMRSGLDSALEGRPNPSPPLLLMRADILSACVPFALLFLTLVRSVCLTLDWRDATARKK